MRIQTRGRAVLLRTKVYRDWTEAKPRLKTNDLNYNNDELDRFNSIDYKKQYMIPRDNVSNLMQPHSLPRGHLAAVDRLKRLQKAALQHVH